MSTLIQGIKVFFLSRKYRSVAVLLTKFGQSLTLLFFSWNFVWIILFVVSLSFLFGFIFFSPIILALLPVLFLVNRMLALLHGYIKDQIYVKLSYGVDKLIPYYPSLLRWMRNMTFIFCSDPTAFGILSLSLGIVFLVLAPIIAWGNCMSFMTYAGENSFIIFSFLDEIYYSTFHRHHWRWAGFSFRFDFAKLSFQLPKFTFVPIEMMV
jgi:hypothetical protein